MGGGQAAAGRMHGDFGSLLIAQHLRILEDLGAGCLGGARQPLSELERMQVAAARVDQPSEIAAAPYMRLQFVAIQQAGGWGVVLFVQFTGPIRQPLEMPRRERKLNVV